MNCEKVIKEYRKNTKRIININASHVSVERTEVVEDDGVVISEIQKNIGSEIVRFYHIKNTQNESLDKMGQNAVIAEKKYKMIAECDANIQKNDTLYTDEGERYIVLSLEKICAFGYDAEHCYKLNAIVEKIEGDIKAF